MDIEMEGEEEERKKWEVLTEVMIETGRNICCEMTDSRLSMDDWSWEPVRKNEKGNLGSGQWEEYESLEHKGNLITKTETETGENESCETVTRERKGSSEAG